MFVQRSQLINQTIAAGSVGNTQIQDQPMLRQQYVVGIEAYTSDMMSFAPINPTLPVATAAQLKNSFLTLYYIDPNPHPADNNRVTGYLVENIPLIELVNLNQTGVPFNWERLKFDCLSIQWDKCYITTTGTPPDSAYNIVLNVYYVSGKVPTSAIGATADQNSIIAYLLDRLNKLENWIQTTFGKK